MVTLRKNKRGRNRWVSGDFTSHAQVNIGPFAYADRELWGVRMRSIWLFGRKLKSWKVEVR